MPKLQLAAFSAALQGDWQHPATSSVEMARLRSSSRFVPETGSATGRRPSLDTPLVHDNEVAGLRPEQSWRPADSCDACSVDRLMNPETTIGVTERSPGPCRRKGRCNRRGPARQRSSPKHYRKSRHTYLSDPLIGPSWITDSDISLPRSHNMPHRMATIVSPRPPEGAAPDDTHRTKAIRRLAEALLAVWAESGSGCSMRRQPRFAERAVVSPEAPSGTLESA
jgi:hypothetical protein